MPEPLSTDDVANVGKLAMLDLAPDELEMFTSQLGAVLEHAADIAALDLANVPPTHHPFHLTNVMRDDVVDLPDLRGEMLAAAPSVEDDQFRVPPALGEEP